MSRDEAMTVKDAIFWIGKLFGKNSFADHFHEASDVVLDHIETQATTVAEQAELIAAQNTAGQEQAAEVERLKAVLAGLRQVLQMSAELSALKSGGPR